jgi:hypothetical protein
MAEATPTRERRAPRTWWQVALVAIGVTAVTVGVIGLVGSGSQPVPTDRARQNASVSPDAQGSDAPASDVSVDDAGPLGDLITHDGDAVVGVGMIIDAYGEPMLCQTLPVAALLAVGGDQAPPTCSALAVRLSDVDVSALPGWTEREGVGFTDGVVTINGIWRDRALAVESVTAGGSTGEPMRENFWSVPCAPPVGGWVEGDGVLTAGVDPEAYEAMMAALDAELGANAERYHGLRIGYPDGNPSSPTAPHGDHGEPLPAHDVVVVSTLDDPADAHVRLATIYSGNLCVTQVEHSLAELDALVERLVVPDDSWELDADSLNALLANKVQLALPVLDDAAMSRIGDDAAAIEVSPLVRPS